MGQRGILKKWAQGHKAIFCKFPHKMENLKLGESEIKDQLSIPA